VNHFVHKLSDFFLIFCDFFSVQFPCSIELAWLLLKGFPSKYKLFAFYAFEVVDSENHISFGQFSLEIVENSQEVDIQYFDFGAPLITHQFET
jgi:hypothetical protein